MPVPRKSREPFQAATLLAAKPSGGRFRRLSVAASVAVHVLFAVGLILLPSRFVDRQKPKKIEIVFYPPTKPKLTPPPVVPEPEPPPVEVAEVKPPKPKPKPKPVVEPEPEPPPQIVRNDPPRPKPKPKVKTDVFKEPVVAEKKAPPKRTTHTGGFTKTKKPEPAPAPARRAVARVGNFADKPDVEPSTPAKRVVSRLDDFETGSDNREAPVGQENTRVVAAGHFGGGAVSVPREGKPRAAATTVVTTAFNDTDTAGNGGGPRPEGTVQPGGFADGAVATQQRNRRARPAADLDSPVSIISKPKPVYTEEARKKHIEGEVVLEVIFVASGRLEVHRVVDSLGYGLDEAAIEAARNIEFKPARRGGRPVDHTATLRVVFRLA